MPKAASHPFGVLGAQVWNVGTLLTTCQIWYSLLLQVPLGAGEGLGELEGEGEGLQK